MIIAVQRGPASVQEALPLPVETVSRFRCLVEVCTSNSMSKLSDIVTTLNCPVKTLAEAPLSESNVRANHCSSRYQLLFLDFVQTWLFG